MAGHYVDNLRQKLNSITFVNTNISIIGSDKQTLINRGWNLDELNSINEILIRIAKAQSLQAWLGEAINAKNKTITNKLLKIKLLKYLINFCSLFSFMVHYMFVFLIYEKKLFS